MVRSFAGWWVGREGGFERILPGSIVREFTQKFRRGGGKESDYLASAIGRTLSACHAPTSMLVFFSAMRQVAGMSRQALPSLLLHRHVTHTHTHACRPPPPKDMDTWASHWRNVVDRYYSTSPAASCRVVSCRVMTVGFVSLPPGVAPAPVGTWVRSSGRRWRWARLPGAWAIVGNGFGFAARRMDCCPSDNR